MSLTPSKTVFIIDDDADLRDALSLLMRAAGLHAETFATAREFLHHHGPRDAGCLVLDIRMPGMSGIELQAELHKRRSRLPIVFLTGHADVALAVKAMKAGAADFIQKPLEEHRLVVAVLNALKTYADQGGTTEPSPHDEAGDNRLASLTQRERDVLDLMIGGKQNRDIAETLCIRIKTVDFHRANIKEKLGVTNLPELFKLVLSR